MQVGSKRAAEPENSFSPPPLLPLLTYSRQTNSFIVIKVEYAERTQKYQVKNSSLTQRLARAPAPSRLRCACASTAGMRAAHDAFLCAMEDEALRYNEKGKGANTTWVFIANQVKKNRPRCICQR